MLLSLYLYIYTHTLLIITSYLQLQPTLTLSNQSIMEQSSQVAVIAVPLPAQGHLNQMLQLSYLIASDDIPVYYVGSALHNRQARARVNDLSTRDMAKINFHDIPTPTFLSPPPDPNSRNKFPTHLYPTWDSTFHLREPVTAFLHNVANRFRRVVVIHDFCMSYVVQEVASILNAESYAFNCFSAFHHISFICDQLGKPFPVEHPKELPSLEGLVSDKLIHFGAAQAEPLSYRSGDIFNTCRLMEAPYLEALEREEVLGKIKNWALGPILPNPTKLSSSRHQHECLKWLDEQEPKSVIYVSFGTTVSLSDEEITEIAYGLERSRVKFLWVLRDADKGDIFDGEVRRAELPEGFEERLAGVGMVVRDWAPQLQILGHQSTGGFMSHCGWNSSIESITMGVPIAAWPMHSDQANNTALVTDVLKIGFDVRDWKRRTEVVKASTVEDAVRRLMASEEGDEVRKRAEELGATIRQATQPGGASRLELDSFTAHITR